MYDNMTSKNNQFYAQCSKMSRRNLGWMGSYDVVAFFFHWGSITCFNTKRTAP